MNEKIKLLADQCQIEEYNSVGDLVEFGFDHEKFAELIVQECADIAKETRWAVPPSQEQIARSIRQHFGVEK